MKEAALNSYEKFLSLKPTERKRQKTAGQDNGRVEATLKEDAHHPPHPASLTRPGRPHTIDMNRSTLCNEFKQS
jgi:hypothetical protein